MAPEVVANGQLTKTSDVYSFGVISESWGRQRPLYDVVGRGKLFNALCICAMPGLRPESGGYVMTRHLTSRGSAQGFRLEGCQSSMGDREGLQLWQCCALSAFGPPHSPFTVYGPAHDRHSVVTGLVAARPAHFLVSQSWPFSQCSPLCCC